MSIFARLGRALRFLRERQGRSQKEVAAAADITPPMLSAYENERASPELETLDRILRLGLAVTLEDLGWAIEVVNDRVASSVETLRVQRGAGHGHDSLGRVGPAGSATIAAPADLKLACAEVARGLFKMSQAMLAALVEAPRRPNE